MIQAIRPERRIRGLVHPDLPKVTVVGNIACNECYSSDKRADTNPNRDACLGGSAPEAKHIGNRGSGNHRQQENQRRQRYNSVFNLHNGFAGTNVVDRLNDSR